MNDLVQLTRFHRPDAPWLLRRRELIPVPPARVWQALTDASELAIWWGAGAALDDREDGAFRVGHAPAPPGAADAATVVRIEPERRLELSWPIDGVTTRVEIDLEESLGQTELRVLQYAEEPLTWAPESANWWWVVLPRLRHAIESGTCALELAKADLASAPPFELEIGCTTFPWVVWSKLTDARELARWWGTDVEIDLTPNGRFTLGSPAGPTRILDVGDDGRFTHDWVDGDHTSRVEWSVGDAEDATIVRLRDLGPWPPESAPRRVLEWASTLLSLKQMSERGITPREYQDGGSR